jgi:quercetin dioxygenase-like cupin family protein
MTMTPRRHPDTDAVWFLNDLIIPLAGPSDTDGVVAVVEGLYPPGDATPFHVHHDDHEALYVLEGAVTLHCGKERFDAAEGDFLWAPKGVEHAIVVSEDGPARMLTLAFPGRFLDFVAELGVPAPEHRLPDHRPLDPEHLGRVAAQHGITITGPPPSSPSA